MTESLGYQVLTADTPQEALRLCQEHPGEIHLLLTDVIMPEMNGRDLAEHVRTLRPGIRIVYMSGYTANVIARQGILAAGSHFVQKPFEKAQLAEVLRAALADGANSPPRPA